MPEHVDIRTLKAKAGQIVRAVQQGRRYVVTVHGRPAALLVPLEAPSQAQGTDAWEELLRLRETVAWNTERSTGKLLDGVRGRGG